MSYVNRCGASALASDLSSSHALLRRCCAVYFVFFDSSDAHALALPLLLRETVLAKHHEHERSPSVARKGTVDVDRAASRVKRTRETKRSMTIGSTCLKKQTFPRIVKNLKIKFPNYQFCISETDKDVGAPRLPAAVPSRRAKII